MDILTIGETMAAFASRYPGPLRYADSFHMRSAGAESNTAVGAAKLGLQTEWYSRLGEDEFGRFVRNRIRAEGVNCEHVVFDENRPTGIMFKEQSGGETKVNYYRQNSAAAAMTPEDLQAEMFSDVKIVHMTGITPILSESCRDTTFAAFERAKKAGAAVSFDPNIRQKLWKGVDYKDMLRELALDSDILLMGLEEGAVLFGTEDKERLQELVFTRGRAKYLAIKNGKAGAFVSDGTQCFEIHPYPCHCVDPVGAGDGFNAGFLTGVLMGRPLEICGKMAGICGAMATQCVGDAEGYPDEKQMEQMLAGTEIIYR